MSDPPLLVQLIEHNARESPLSFFIEDVIGLIQDAWAYLVAKHGILPELHGQNALMEIGSDGRPTRVIQRDFQSLYSDGLIRDAMRLPQFEKHVIGMEDNIRREEQYSLVFDHFISRYLMIRLVQVFTGYYSQYSFQGTCDIIRDRFRAIRDNRLDVFPNTTFRFSDHVMVDNEVRLIDTGELPLFR